jgi:hypothetical protein
MLRSAVRGTVMIRVFGLIVFGVLHGAHTLAGECPQVVGTLVVELPREVETSSRDSLVAETPKLTETVSIVHAGADGALGVGAHPGGIVAFDLSDPAQPQVLGFSPEDAWTAPAWSPPRCVAVVGDHAIVCDDYNEQLVVFDVSDPNAIKPVAYVPAVDVNDITIRGSLAYVAGRQFQIVDFTDPAEPVAVGEVTFNAWRSFVAVEHPFAYVTEWTEGLFTGLTVVDVSDPSHPVSVGQAFRGELYCCGPLAVADSVVYVADSPVEDLAFLHVVDVSDPANPVEVDYEDWITARSVEVVGQTLLVSTAPYMNPPVDGVFEYDISTPGQLEEVGRQDIPRGSISASGDLALIASGSNGIQIVRPCGSGPRIFTDDLLRRTEGQ